MKLNEKTIHLKSKKKILRWTYTSCRHIDNLTEIFVIFRMKIRIFTLLNLCKYAFLQLFIGYTKSLCRIRRSFILIFLLKYMKNNKKNSCLIFFFKIFDEQLKEWILSLSLLFFCFKLCFFLTHNLLYRKRLQWLKIKQHNS